MISVSVPTLHDRHGCSILEPENVAVWRHLAPPANPDELAGQLPSREVDSRNIQLSQPQDVLILP